VALPAPSADATILVTGASSGIGAELARQLAQRGHGVTLTARRREELEQLAREIEQAHGVAAQVEPLDLADDQQRTGLIERLRTSGRQIAAVCNNAGFGTFGAFHKLALEREVEEVRVNVLALQELTGAFLGPMVERGEGAILNVASIAAFQPQPSNATYAATKAFVLSFSEAVHTDLAGTGVSCTALCPGPVRTPFVEVSGGDKLEGLAPKFVWQTAEQVARAAIDGMAAGRRTVVPGITNRATAIGGRFAPRSIFLPIASRLTRSRLERD
jgi:short-subunit dehydrogenase